jgi:hypothetical protein
MSPDDFLDTVAYIENVREEERKARIRAKAGA